MQLMVHLQGDQTRALGPLDWRQDHMWLWTQLWTPVYLFLTLGFHFLFYYFGSDPLYSQQKRSGKGSVGKDQGPGTPLPSSRWGNWLSSSECPSRGDGAGLCRMRVDGAESQPGGCCGYTCHKQRGAVDRQPAWGQDTWSWLWLCHTQGHSGHILPLPGVQLLLLYDERVGLSRGPLHSLLSSTVRG